MTDHIFTPKPWGHEWLAYQDAKCAVWVLQLNAGARTSLHCHPKKRTELIVLQGEASVTRETKTRDVLPLQSIGIPAGFYHRTASERGAVVMEIEWPPLKEDIVRKEDDYGRAGMPYGERAAPDMNGRLHLGREPVAAHGLEFAVVADTPRLQIGDITRFWWLGSENFLMIRRARATV